MWLRLVLTLFLLIPICRARNEPRYGYTSRAFDRSSIEAPPDAISNDNYDKSSFQNQRSRIRPDVTFDRSSVESNNENALKLTYYGAAAAFTPKRARSDKEGSEYLPLREAVEARPREASFYVQNEEGA
jgi:hypothetical protein